MAAEVQTGRGDPLAAALLPVLLHELNNTTQLLCALNTLLAQPGGAALEGGGADALAAAAGEVDASGWLLALTSAACGADLLLERRERAGLEPLLRLVGKALRREGRSLAPGPVPLPLLDPAVGDGWQLPWSLASWLWTAGRALPEGAQLDWDLRRQGGRVVLCAVARRGPELERLAQRLEASLPAACCRFDVAGAQLSLPQEWLPLAPEGL